MDQIKTGSLIRTLRCRQDLTQLALAQRIGVSDKAVSKWERGCGAPDISLLPALVQALRVDMQALVQGSLPQQERSGGSLKTLRFFVCPACGNLLFSLHGGRLSCCGAPLEPLTPRSPDEAHRLSVRVSDGEWYLTGTHEMQREHFLSFAALAAGDTVVLKKLYPEWGPEARLSLLGHGTLFWYCTRHGLFSQTV